MGGGGIRLGFVSLIFRVLRAFRCVGFSQRRQGSAKTAKKTKDLGRGWWVVSAWYGLNDFWMARWHCAAGLSMRVVWGAIVLRWT
jgi:hypothetical protein